MTRENFIPQHPSEIIEPSCGDYMLLTRSPVRSIASRADLADQATRPGSEVAYNYPSRIGDRLHHRGGRVTDLSGKPINHESHSHD